MDFDKFLRVNGLRQSEIANFLGVSAPSVSNLAKGKSKPSKDNLAKLLNNDRGWDTSMLIDGNGQVAANGGVAIGKKSNFFAKSDDFADIAVLRKENEMLKQQLSDKDAQIDFLKTLITAKQ